MLEILCGSKSVERILLFLFVNEKCYGAQLQRLLQTSLTPLQKALERLERGGIIISYLQGKTKMYQFNPAYPMLDELSILLRKTYTLLPITEKKHYTFIKFVEDSGKITAGNKQKINATLLAFWKRLSNVRSLTFISVAKGKSETGWNGKGKALVQLVRENTSTLVFQEKGTWVDKNEQEFDFSNSFRWTLDLSLGSISLEHLRHGPNRPVFLFYLTPSGEKSLESIDSCLCDSDTYLGQVRFDENTIRLSWRVIGPKKNEEIDRFYC